MKQRKTWIVAVLCLALLAAIGISQWSAPSAQDAQPYHQRVSQVVQGWPHELGVWSGVDEPVPAAATELLAPNAVLHRTYRDHAAGRSATLMIVQCRDARNLAGHFPPICYPAHGWRLEHQSPRRWRCGEALLIDGMEYIFSYGGVAGSQRMSVANFMILPDGRIAPDMAAVRRVAADYKQRHFGAAQVQVLTDARLPDRQRDRMIAELIHEHRGVIHSIQSGIQ